MQARQSATSDCQQKEQQGVQLEPSCLERAARALLQKGLSCLAYAYSKMHRQRSGEEINIQ
jgi:hypothetical protein